MYRPKCYILLWLVLSYLQGMSQSVFATGAYIDTHSSLDFVLGEMVAEYTSSAAIGFLPAMYYTTFSSEKQLTDTAAVQVHFDNERQQATIFMAHEMLRYNPQYLVCGMDGVVYLQGLITSIPQFVRYAQLPAGIYILRVSGIPNHIPYITKWVKK